MEPGTVVGNPSGANPGNEVLTQPPHPSDVAVNPDPKEIIPLKEPIDDPDPVEIHGGTAHSDVTHGVRAMDLESDSDGKPEKPVTKSKS